MSEFRDDVDISRWAALMNAHKTLKKQIDLASHEEFKNDKETYEFLRCLYNDCKRFSIAFHNATNPYD